jgi:7-cyano-7-deazaguanine synthase
MLAAPSAPIGLLISGGLDSAVLLGHLLHRGRVVQPLYVRAGLHWEAAEKSALDRLLARLAGPKLRPLVSFDMPLADIYADHWSVTGRDVPDHRTPDESVYLPGRNALLLIKAVVWCELNGITELALAPLGSNPFSDATPEFFRDFQAALNRATGAALSIIRPFADLHKRDVMALGHGLPLELTFSCIAPIEGNHCGGCNKCAERREAFRLAGITDHTHYVAGEPAR